MKNPHLGADIRRRQVLSVVLFALIQMLSLVSPWLMGVIIDQYIPARDFGKIYGGIALFVIVPFASILLQTLYNYFTIKYVRKKGNQWSLKIMEKLIYQDMSFYDHENSLELLSYAGKEAVSYLNFHVAEMSRYYVSIAIAALTEVLLISIHPVLGLLQLLYIPIALYPARGISKNVEKELATVLCKNAEMSQIKGDVFKAIEFIKLYRLESQKLHQVDEKNEAINKVWGKISSLDSLSGIWASGFATVLFTGLTFGIGAVLILTGTGLQVGALVSVLTYSALFYSNINSILQTGISKRKQEVEYSKIFSYLEMDDERSHTGSASCQAEKNISFRNCTFGYGEEPVLKNLSMELPMGKWTGIVGPSGSGKSTVLDLIMKLYPAPEQSIFLDDTDITSVDSFSIREQMTKITQNIFLFPGTVEDNLRLAKPEATRQELENALDFACLTDYIHSLPKGLETDVGEAGKLMSGGERQRLSIAMGVLRGKKIFLLDEVTANLDPTVEAKLADNFHRLAQEGCTIISISHKPDFQKYADKLYRIENGCAQEIK